MVKCTGTQPCDACIRANSECVYATEDDGRRKEARKRKVQDLRDDSNLLNDLIETFQASKDEEVAELLSIIRSNAPVQDLKVCVKQQIAKARVGKRLPSPELEQLHTRIQRLPTEGVSDPKRRLPQEQGKFSRAAHVSEEPPYMVRASPWTDVTADDMLVSNLVSVFFRWHKSMYDWMDEDLFLRDMRQGDLQCSYCSPVLVNALLAVACPYSDYDEAKTKPGALSPLMSAFLAEAMSLLDGYEARPSIATAQALAMLNVALAANGQDGVGYQYLKHATSMCKGLQLKFRAVRNTDKATSEERVFSSVLDTTCWGVFNFMVMASMVYHRPTETSQPRRSLPEPVEDSHLWTPYPLSGPTRLYYSRELLHHYTSLSIILRDAMSLLYGHGGDPTEHERDRLEEAILQMHVRLSQWHRSLPEHLSVRSDSPPSVLAQQYVSH